MDENDLNAVKRFKDVVTRELQSRFDVKRKENQDVVVFATIPDPDITILNPALLLT